MELAKSIGGAASRQERSAHRELPCLAFLWPLVLLALVWCSWPWFGVLGLLGPLFFLLSHASQSDLSQVMTLTPLQMCPGLGTAKKPGCDGLPTQLSWHKLELSSGSFSYCFCVIFHRSQDSHRDRDRDLCRVGDQDHY